VTWIAAGTLPLARLRDGDLVRVCAESGTLAALVEPGEWEHREPAPVPAAPLGTGRELFALLRHHCDEAERGGSAMLAAAGL
jgi:phosphogluconate dehydratase